MPATPHSRVVATLFLLVVSLGYLAALSNVFFTTGDMTLDGKSDVQDIAAKFHGSDKLTRLTVAIRTTMREHLESEAEVETIERWVFGAKDEATYDEVIAPLLDQRCLKCHDAFGEAEKLPLTTYKQVLPYTEPFRGKTWQALAQLSHQHLLGMGVLFFAVGAVLFQRQRRFMLKVWLNSAGFAAIIVDIGGWWLTKLEPSCAYLVMAGGAGHALAFAAMLVLALYEMWVEG